MATPNWETNRNSDLVKWFFFVCLFVFFFIMRYSQIVLFLREGEPWSRRNCKGGRRSSSHISSKYATVAIFLSSPPLTLPVCVLIRLFPKPAHRPASFFHTLNSPDTAKSIIGKGKEKRFLVKGSDAREAFDCWDVAPPVASPFVTPMMPTFLSPVWLSASLADLMRQALESCSCAHWTKNKTAHFSSTCSAVQILYNMMYVISAATR